MVICRENACMPNAGNGVDAEGGIMVSVGLSQNADTRIAVHEAVDRARFRGSASWVLAVAGRRHDAQKALSEIRQALPNVPVYGGSCVGAIGSAQGVNRIGYSGNEIALAIFDADIGAPDVRVVEPIAEREHEAGIEIGNWLSRLSHDASVLLFYDVTREGGGINIGSRLLDGIYSRMSEISGPRIFGAGLISDFQVTRSFLFTGDRVQKNAALALLLPESLRSGTRVMHGCTPVSGMMKVTRAQGARIHELDGRPAVEKLRDLAGATDDEELALAFSVLLGRRAGDPLAPFEEVEYINRLIIDIDPRDGSVGLFEEDIRTGDSVQVMARNNSLLMESVESGVEASLAETEDPAFGLYIDCAGRASVFTGSESEESEHLLKQLNNNFPLLGFYVGREIAPFDGRSRPLDWTGVLTIFSKRT